MAHVSTTYHSHFLNYTTVVLVFLHVLAILIRSAVLCLPWKTLKRKEKEYEHEMERLAREKIATQQRLAELKNELSQCMDVIEIDRVLRQTIQPEDDQASTSTASGTGMRCNNSPADIIYYLHI